MSQEDKVLSLNGNMFVRGLCHGCNQAHVTMQAGQYAHGDAVWLCWRCMQQERWYLVMSFADQDRLATVFADALAIYSKAEASGMPRPVVPEGIDWSETHFYGNQFIEVRGPFTPADATSIKFTVHLPHALEPDVDEASLERMLQSLPERVKRQLL